VQHKLNFGCNKKNMDRPGESIYDLIDNIIDLFKKAH